MHFFAWLFGRKERAAPAPVPEMREPAVAVEKPKPAPLAPPPEPPKREPAAAVHDRVVTPPAAPKQPALPPAVENLAKWKASGQARAWVEARRGKWNHDDWLALLADLGRSPFWPMEPDAIGMVLEEHKQEWLRRN